jgi:hypothetical protein
MASSHHIDLHVSQFKPSSNQKTLAIVLLAIGLITFAIGVMKSPERVWTSYLVAFFYFSCLGLGGTFFRGR